MLKFQCTTTACYVTPNLNNLEWHDTKQMATEFSFSVHSGSSPTWILCSISGHTRNRPVTAPGSLESITVPSGLQVSKSNACSDLFSSKATRAQDVTLSQSWTLQFLPFSWSLFHPLLLPPVINYWCFGHYQDNCPTQINSHQGGCTIYGASSSMRLNYAV